MESVRFGQPRNGPPCLAPRRHRCRDVLRHAQERRLGHLGVEQPGRPESMELRGVARPDLVPALAGDEFALFDVGADDLGGLRIRGVVVGRPEEKASVPRCLDWALRSARLRCARAPPARSVRARRRPRPRWRRAKGAREAAGERGACARFTPPGRRRFHLRFAISARGWHLFFELGARDHSHSDHLRARFLTPKNEARSITNTRKEDEGMKVHSGTRRKANSTPRQAERSRAWCVSSSLQTARDPAAPPRMPRSTANASRARSMRPRASSADF